MAVVFFHSFEKWFPNGYLGVDVFFVVSGFIVTPMIWDIFSNSQELSTRDRVKANLLFLVRRFRRLAPAFSIALIFAYFLIFALGPVSDHLRVANQGLASIFLIGNIGAYLYSGGNYFAPNPNPLIHLWSLSVEWQIYLFFPIVCYLLFLFLKPRKSIYFLIITSLGLILFIIDLALNHSSSVLENVGILDASGFLFYSPTARVWEFALGSIAYFTNYPEKSKQRNKKSPINLFGLLLIIILFCPSQLSNQKLASFLVAIISCFVIHFRLFDQKYAFFTELGKWLGNRSYSIYLLHMPLIYVAIYSPIFDNYGYLPVLIAILLTMFLGEISYSQVENRFRHRNGPMRLNDMVSKKTFFALVVAPISITLVFQNSARNSYWGLDPNPRLPITSELDDPRCYLGGVPCEYPAEKSLGKAILIGDSHAAAMFQTFASTMNRFSISAFGYQRGGCRFIIEKTVSSFESEFLDYEIEKPGESQSCFAHNQSIIDWINENPDAIVFISQRSTSLVPVGLTENEFRRIILDNLLLLKRVSSRLVVVGPAPEFPDPQGVFSGGLLIWQQPYLPPKVFLRENMVPEPFRDNQVLQRFSTSQSLDYINLIDEFCTSVTCSRNDFGKWLYSDSEHLTPDGATKLSKRFEERVLNLFPLGN